MNEKGLGKVQFKKDFIKGLFLAALMNILMTLYSIIDGGKWPSNADFIVMAKSTVALIIAYFIKNLGTNNQGELLKKDK